MPKPRPSVTKRQREQTKRDRQAQKAERRAQRKLDNPNPGGGPPIAGPDDDEVPPSPS